MTTASCACGQLGADVDEPPKRVAICHCDACRSRTGSAFSWNARFAASAVRLHGRFQTYRRTGDEGHEITYHFCPDCGVTVWYETSDVPGIAIPVGAFAPARDLPAPGVSVYDDRRPEWLSLPEAMERWT